MKVEIWENEDSISGIVSGESYNELLVDKDAKLLRIIEGEDWNDCMRQHHELMGWNPYIPFEDVDDFS